MTTRLGPQPGDGAVLSAYDGLQIYLPCLDSDGLAPVETAAALLALRCAGVPPGWIRPVVWRRPPADCRPAVRVLLPGPAVSEDQLPPPVAACRLPAAHLPAERLCVAGLCAVVRRGVKTVDRLRRPDDGHYSHRDDSLLGFRRGTLAPPADASLWTRFCERDVPAALRAAMAAVSGETGLSDGSEPTPDNAEPAAVSPDSAPVSPDSAPNAAEPATVSPDSVPNTAEPVTESPNSATGSPGSVTITTELAAVSLDSDPVGPNSAPVTADPTTAHTNPSSVCPARAVLTVPVELIQFEHHMQQPLRVHNVWKQDQASGGTVRNWGSGDHRTGLQCVRHTYAEGHVLTISDLLLYPGLRLMVESLQPHGLSLPQTAPAVSSWMAAVEAVDGLTEMWAACFPPQQQQQTPPPAPLRLTVPDVKPQSLYKKDPARYKPKARLFTVQSEVSAALGRLAAAGFDSRVAPHPGSGRLRLDWAALPAAASPADGGLPASRLRRKHHQLENLAWLAVRAALPGDTIVDFCCGGGHLGLLLAVLRPDCHVVLVENKEESLRRGQERAAALGLANVSLYQCNMEFYRGRFELGVALHACGVATDLVAERCLAAGAAYLCCPCCYGAVHDFGAVRYPRSAAGRRTGAAPRDWLVLGHAADQTHADGSEKSRQGRRCMALVDSDRAAHLQEAGYRVLLTVAEPADCSEKNHLLLAVPPHWSGDGALLAAA